MISCASLVAAHTPTAPGLLAQDIFVEFAAALKAATSLQRDNYFVQPAPPPVIDLTQSDDESVDEPAAVPDDDATVMYDSDDDAGWHAYDVIDVD